MNDSLSAVWQEVTDLLAAGVSIIPVRDREQEGKPPKTPYFQWKQFQQRIIQPEELWHAMETQNTSAVAIICGKVSGNLEAIDIDVKNWPGIDAMLFASIRDLYPDLWSSFRIHATPSGGFHILYRTENTTGVGNLKLATYADRKEAGIETRGEGGYVVAPPSLGYRVHQDNAIPTITNDQRESLINLCRSFNQKIKVERPETVKSEEHYYDENPFAHYNGSPGAESILLDHAWSNAGGNSHYRYFTRPGKDSGISASFNRQTRLYFIFTSSTEFEPDRGYHPASLLAQFQFGGDKRATYRYLVEQGYGKIKPGIEKKLVQRAKELPANASKEAKVLYMEKRTQLDRQYPHGTYWDESDKGVITINREKLYYVSEKIGYRLYKDRLVLQEGYKLTERSERAYYDHVKEYIGVDEAVQNAFESFIQRSGDFTITRLPLLAEEQIMRSTKSVGYKFFSDAFVTISATDITTHSYEELKGRLIWKSQICDRPFALLENVDPAGLYYEFLSLAVGISSYLWRLIGYLTHEYKDETQAYIIVLIEQCPDPKQGGGTGKNLFVNLLGHTTTLKNVSGAQVQLNEKFLQVWNYERVFAINDIPKKFNFGFLKEPAGGSATLKKLFKDEKTIPVHEMPKFILSSNYSFDASDGGLKRRIIPLEFSSFFTRVGGVDVHFGRHFPFEWEAGDWLQYDNIIVRSIQHYLKGGGKLFPMPLTEDGWLKQFDQIHMQLTREFIQQHWDLWLHTRFVTNEMFKDQYTKFSVANNINFKFQLSSARMTYALEDWCAHYKVKFTRDHSIRELLDTKRGRLFEYERAPF